MLLFIQEGLGGEWDDRLGIGKPASYPCIKEYLKSVREEQAQARVQPYKAVPFLRTNLLE